jgi:hypothetical protein
MDPLTQEDRIIEVVCEDAHLLEEIFLENILEHSQGYLAVRQYPNQLIIQCRLVSDPCRNGTKILWSLFR